MSIFEIPRRLRLFLKKKIFFERRLSNTIFYSASLDDCPFPCIGRIGDGEQVVDSWYFLFF